MSTPLRQLRPRAPVNYQVDGDSEDDDSQVDEGGQVDIDAEDEPQDDTKQPFKLFGLPQELRDMVYREALVDPNGVHLWVYPASGVWDCVSHGSSKGMGGAYRKQLSTNLLATCKRVYHEARLVAYRQPFVFSDPQAVPAFLCNLQSSTIGLLKDITIGRLRSTGSNNNNALLSGLSHAMSLTNFRLGSRITSSGFQFSISDHRVGVEVAKRFYTDTSYFIYRFVTSYGIDVLLQVVKFHEEDLQNDQEILHGVPLSEARKDVIMKAVKKQLLKLLKERDTILRR
ncbi:hypothetical protein N0V93_008647 [Gnomoniopsis smithogilvyi]|uniref:Uncharacterized protein n=1 Tax=Gnomoniopsis smithogilvyi TaxID=1191159 RepID=A0A9W8YMD7_9PEZI|nr:hypothetical protein N0V93_008647 [Gnomoniopsis smithogilvyi]